MLYFPFPFEFVVPDPLSAMNALLKSVEFNGKCISDFCFGIKAHISHKLQLQVVGQSPN